MNLEFALHTLIMGNIVPVLQGHYVAVKFRVNLRKN